MKGWPNAAFEVKQPFVIPCLHSACKYCTPSLLLNEFITVLVQMALMYTYSTWINL